MTRWFSAGLYGRRINPIFIVTHDSSETGELDGRD